MLNTNFHRHFGSTGEAVPITDPWGLGVTFYVRPQSNSDYQDFLAARQAKNPMIREIIKVSARAQLIVATRQNGSRKQKKQTDPAKQAAQDAAEEQMLAESMAASAKDLDISDEGIDELLKDNSEGIAMHILAAPGWEGLHDGTEPVEFSIEKAVELMGDRSLVPMVDDDGNKVKFGGMSLGRAVQHFLLEASQGQDLVRAGILEVEAEALEHASNGV